MKKLLILLMCTTHLLCAQTIELQGVSENYVPHEWSENKRTFVKINGSYFHVAQVFNGTNYGIILKEFDISSFNTGPINVYKYFNDNTNSLCYPSTISINHIGLEDVTVNDRIFGREHIVVTGTIPYDQHVGNLIAKFFMIIDPLNGNVVSSRVLSNFNSNESYHGKMMSTQDINGNHFFIWGFEQSTSPNKHGYYVVKMNSITQHLQEVRHEFDDFALTSCSTSVVSFNVSGIHVKNSDVFAVFNVGVTNFSNPRIAISHIDGSTSTTINSRYYDNFGMSAGFLTSDIDLNNNLIYVASRQANPGYDGFNLLTVDFGLNLTTTPQNLHTTNNIDYIETPRSLKYNHSTNEVVVGVNYEDGSGNNPLNIGRVKLVGGIHPIPFLSEFIQPMSIPQFLEDIHYESTEEIYIYENDPNVTFVKDYWNVDYESCLHNVLNPITIILPQPTICSIFYLTNISIRNDTFCVDLPLFIGRYENCLGDQDEFETQSILGGGSFKNESALGNLMPDTENQLSLYPNPSFGEVNVNSTFEEELKISVYSVLGVLVYKKEIRKGTNNLDALKSGMYLLQFSNKQGEILRKEKLIVK